MPSLPTHLKQVAQGEAGKKTIPIPCRFFAQGRCREGTACQFLHSTSLIPVLPQQDTRSRVPCRYFLEGRCQNGDTCPFAHIVAHDVDQNIPIQTQDHPRVDDWVRNLYGALITFGDGAQVLKLNLPSDFSAVRLSKLPANTTSQSVKDKLNEMGFTVPLDGIRLLPDGDTGRYVADVRVEDAAFAKSLCSTINIQHHKADEQAKTGLIDATPINNPLPKGSNSARVDCKKVHMSWYRKVRLAWLNFASEAIAEKVAGKYTTGKYKVLGQVIGCKRPKHSNTNRRTSVPWTLVLSDVPGVATEAEILKDIPTAIKPKHIELGAPTYEESTGEMNAIVKSLLTHLGPLELWEDATDTSGRRAKARARFQDDDQAQKAAASLNNAVLSSNGAVKLTIQLVYSARMKETERIYQAVRTEIEKERRVWKADHILFIPYPAAKGYRVLKLEGEDSGKIAQVKKSLDRILAGNVVLEEDGRKPVWVPEFGTYGRIFQKTKEIEKSLAIAIVRDRRRCQLRLYGPEDKRQQATELLLALTKEASSTTHVIELGNKELIWACRGGFREISQALLNSTVTFDVVSTPKRIQVTGSEIDYEFALNMVAQLPRTELERQSSSSSSSLAGDGSGSSNNNKIKAPTDCSICWTEADDPVNTKCGHTYCSDCFERLCSSISFSTQPGSDPTSALVVCVGDLDKCQTVFPLSELQEHLSSSVFEDLLHASFTAYVRRRQEIFRYCPTPGCEQVYRCYDGQTPGTGADKEKTSSSPAVREHIFVCPGCLAAVCTKCHVSHVGMTCAEFKEDSVGGSKALEKAKAEIGAKDCPKCKTVIMKSDGCDHITCDGCKIHFCWKCLAAYTRAGDCYQHMNKVHGGIGLGRDEYYDVNFF